MKTSRSIGVAIVALGLLLGASLAYQALLNRPPVPPVHYTLLDGRTLDTTQWRGKVTLVNFWATSCASCIQEMPRIVATHQKFQARGFSTLAVAMSYDNLDYVTHFARTRQLPFDVALDHGGALAEALGHVELTPTSLLINKRGQIVKRYVGAPDFDALNALVERLLNEA